MAGLGTAMAAMGGIGEGRRNAYLDQLTAQHNAAAEAQAQAQMAETIRANKAGETRNVALDASNDALNKAQIAKYGADASKLTKDTAAADAATASVTAFRKTLEPGGTNAIPTDFAKKPDAEKIAFFQRLGTAALAAGDNDTAKEAGTYASNIALSTQRESTANLNTHRVGLVDAQAAATRDLPQRVREVAAGRNATALQRQEVANAGRASLAQFNANARAGIVELAAAYRTQNIDAQNSVRMAIADYNGRVREYVQSNSPQSQVLNGPSQAQPPQILAIPGAAGGPTFNITFDSKGNAVPLPAQTPAGGGNGGAPKTPADTSKSDPAKIGNIVTRARAAGKTDAQILAAAKSAGYDLTVVQRVLSAGRPAAPGLQPLPVIKGVSPQLLGQ